MFPGELYSAQKESAVLSGAPTHAHPDGSCDFTYILTITAEQCAQDKATLEARKATIATNVQAEIDKQTAVVDAQLAQFP